MVVTFKIFLYPNAYRFIFGVFRMHRSLTSADVAHASVVSRSEAASRALADHGYAAPSQPAARHRHASLAACAKPSAGMTPVVPVCVGPPAKRRRRDMMTSQFGESDVASGDSFQNRNSP